MNNNYELINQIHLTEKGKEFGKSEILFDTLSDAMHDLFGQSFVLVMALNLNVFYTDKEVCEFLKCTQETLDCIVDELVVKGYVEFFDCYEKVVCGDDDEVLIITKVNH